MKNPGLGTIKQKRTGSWDDNGQREPKFKAFSPVISVGTCVVYALGQWEKLEVFLTDGRVQPDNNLTENAIRPTAIGKKNWLFMRDPKGGGRAAVFYTLITNCHRAGADAQAYLTDLFTRLPLPEETTKNLARLTPHGWAAERPITAPATLAA